MLYKSNLKTVVQAGLAAFTVYFCMYAIRKPFTVAIFEGIEVLGADYKVLLILSQAMGYALSKFLGIRVISALKSEQRGKKIVIYLLLAELALLAFAVTPAPYNIIFMFLNGIPLGMIWGLVFSFLEGRKNTELLAAILSASFIFSAGMTKSIGKFIMLNWNVTEFWMPFVTGLMPFPILLVSVYFLERVEPPKDIDRALRSRREPMTKADRKFMFRQTAGVIVPIVVMFFFLTAYRDYRDNFLPEIWNTVGYENDPSVFYTTETMIAVLVLVIMALFVMLKNNQKAFLYLQLCMFFGTSTIIAGNILHHFNLIDPYYWMFIIGSGIYLAYVPMGCFVFERMVAVFRYKGNAGYLIYLADSFGYLGSILILIYAEFMYTGGSVYDFFISMSYWSPLVCMLCILFAIFHFRKSMSQLNPNPSHGKVK